MTMARGIKLYHVTTGIVCKGEDVTNYRSKNVLAKDAEHAIREAKKRFQRGEYAESVSVVGHVDD
jgi:1,2-phenylacetyl-CoA epoxidase PaaB subunit